MVLLFLAIAGMVVANSCKKLLGAFLLGFLALFDGLPFFNGVSLNGYQPYQQVFMYIFACLNFRKSLGTSVVVSVQIDFVPKQTIETHISPLSSSYNEKLGC